MGMTISNDTSLVRVKVFPWICHACTCLLYAIASIYILQTVSHIANHGFRQPFQDQYSTYPTYIEKSFPSNVLESENGHRPIIPAIIRVAEIQFFKSNQKLQLWIGTLFLLSSFALLLRFVLAKQDISPIHKAQIILLCTLALFWMGNARMQMHGNESLHVYGVILSVVAALGWMYGEGVNPTRAGIIKIITAATIATFCFGNGLVIFPTLCILAVLHRWPLRALSVLLTSTLLMSVIYTKLLPGGERIGTIPWDNLIDGISFGLSWLSNAPFAAWLAMGDWDTDRINYIGSFTHAGWVAHSARAYTNGQDLATLALRFSFELSVASVLIAGFIFIYHLRKPMNSALQFFSVGLMIFVGGTGLLIVLFRVAYFMSNPNQILADRYIPWSCLWWLSLGLYMISTKIFTRSKITQGIGIIGCLLLAWGLSFTQITGGRWSAISAQKLQTFAITQRLGIEDLSMMQAYGIESLERTRSTTKLLRQHALAMFAEPLSYPIGSAAPNANGDTLVSHFKFSEKANTPKDQPTSIHFSGSLPNNAQSKRIVEMIVVDQHGVVAGAASRTWLGDQSGPLWGIGIGLEQKIGFDGYIVAFKAKNSYMLRVRQGDGIWLNAGAIPVVDT